MNLVEGHIHPGGWANICGRRYVPVRGDASCLAGLTMMFHEYKEPYIDGGEIRQRLTGLACLWGAPGMYGRPAEEWRVHDLALLYDNEGVRLRFWRLA